MRFGLVHRLMTDALAALGVLALVASGQFSRVVSAIVLVGLALALAVRESWQRHPAFRYVDTAGLLALVAVQIGRAALGASVLDVLVEFAVGLQVVRLATRKGAAHDQQVIVLALLHLIAGTVLGGGLAYGLCFLGVLVVAPGALVLSHLRREVEGNYRQGARDRTGQPVDVPRILRSRRVVGKTFLAVTCLLAFPILAFTAALFVVFPRVGLSLLLLGRGGTGRMVGFSGKVDLGEVGVLRHDPTLAMRVEVPHLGESPPQRLRLHLRGTALDAYDGRSWTQSEAFQRPALDVEGQGRVPLEPGRAAPSGGFLRIELEPFDPPVLFFPPNATALKLRTRLVGFDQGALAYRRPEGEVRYQPVDERGIKYEVLLSAKNEPTFVRLPAAERARYLALPNDLPARIRDLAGAWAEGAEGPEDKARAIEARLRKDYAYALDSPSGKAEQPLDDFLFESKRGHCEFYSTAMAVMLRSLEVPTRNVTGFIGGTYNRFGGYYAVRQGDAHSWVEVYVDGRGWMTFDPTPPASAAPQSEVTGAFAFLRDFFEATSQRWDRHVVGYDLQQQVGLFSRLASRYRRGEGAKERTPVWRTVAIGIGVSAGAGALYLLWRRRRRAAPPGGGPEEKRSPAAIAATALYESLESVMSALGLSRPRGVPPLRHAEGLALRAHPHATEILELTRIYLRHRFGGEALTKEVHADFERRVALLRSEASKRRGRPADAAEA